MQKLNATEIAVKEARKAERVEILRLLDKAKSLEDAIKAVEEKGD